MSKSFDSHFNPPLNNRHSRTPSFSSLLLDSIYRSLDADVDSDDISDSIPPPSTARATPDLLLPSSSSSPTTTTADPPLKPTKKDKSVNLKRAIMIDHWIDKQQDKQERLLSHLYCVPTRKPNRRSSSCASAATPATSYTSSSSSESVIVAAATGSCSEADFASCFATPQLPLKIRTTFASRSSTDSRSSPPQPSTSRPFITRTKSRALKIYADLKKANQQPTSPGAKIAGFLNSIFTGSNRNNNKKQHSSSDRQQKPVPPPPSASTSNSSSACSSASSFSRSCLSKSTAPSSSSSSGNAESLSSGKRSVRFYPLSVIVGEDSRPCGHKFLYERSESKPVRTVKSKLMKLPNVGRSNPWYLRDKENELDGNDEREMIGGGEGDGDDAESYASSDLFELENIEAVGGRYGYDEELPVYGTTNLEKNKAIAKNGFLL